MSITRRSLIGGAAALLAGLKLSGRATSEPAPALLKAPSPATYSVGETIGFRIIPSSGAVVEMVAGQDISPGQLLRATLKGELEPCDDETDPSFFGVASMDQPSLARGRVRVVTGQRT